MKIQNLKELQKVISLCQKTGVTSIKIDGIELLLGPMPNKPPKQVDFSADFPEASLSVPKYAPTTRSDEVKSIADKIATDELTQDQLMFYSAQGHTEAQ